MDNGASSYHRFLDGDENAINEIVDEYCDGLILYINSFVNNFSVAENLAQDTFVKILVKKPRNSFKASFKTWLYTIGRNTAIDYLRKSNKNCSVSFEEVENNLKDEEQLETIFIKEANKITVHKALKKIKPEYARVLWLKYFEDMTNKEISIVVKKSVHCVENQLTRAKKALKEELLKEGFTYEIT